MVLDSLGTKDGMLTEPWLSRREDKGPQRQSSGKWEDILGSESSPSGGWGEGGNKDPPLSCLLMDRSWINV